MKGHRWALLAGVLALGPGYAQEPVKSAALVDKVLFNRDVRPILSDNCFKCHGPDAKANKSGLRLDSREEALKPLADGGRAIVPGKPAESELYQRITTKEKADVMPPPKSNKKLTPAQIDTLRRWIEQGAEYQGHWAFVAPQRPPLPKPRNAAWVRTPVDAFILSRLEKEGLSPSPETDRVTLLRRLSFDLLGLPPRVEDVDAFVADRATDAVDKQVTRLLASPHYGERMAVFWLDLVRFGNSRGIHSDNPRMVDPYRDYVIQAFNENLPFDRFTTEQLAGDLLPDATLRQRVASCYNKLNLTTEEGGAQAKEYENKTNADRVRAVSTVWLAGTMGCAECHDHKFDPFTMRDFYSMAAFFADVREGAIGDGDKGIPVPTPEQEQELRRLDAAVAALKQKLETPTPELAAAQAEWEKGSLTVDPWTVARPASVKSAGGATFAQQDDGSLLAGGPSPEKDTHTVVLKAPKGSTGFRLEALAHPSLPGNGPGRASNGNFVLTKVTAKAGAKNVALQNGVADHSQEQFSIASALDNKAGGGWAVLPHVGKDHAAVVEFKEPVEGDLTLTLEYQSPYAQHAIGRFRISTTTTRNPSKAAVPPEAVRSALAVPAAQRTPAQKDAVAAYFRGIAPALDPVRAELARAEQKKADFLKGIPTCLVSVSAAPRVVRIRPRGNWMDDSGEVTPPDTPKFLPPLGVEGRRATRLDLARWICSKDNPLTARVFVNRLWKLFFGLGLSKILDDLGAQGEWPVHPELLDWLAVEFVESGWDVKHLVRLLVTSSAYRQTSVPRPDLKERDPFNRLIARQSRWRLDAENVRDNALAVSGLLVTKVGGVSVFPYQPKGYWSFLNFPTREWQNSTGPDLWRRGVYTWWQRTFPHPSLVAFDAPQREECCAERVRSNIPQQALVLLNDPTYVEAARVFAERILREGGATVDDRLQYAFRRALSRKAGPEELKVLSSLVRKHLEQYAADPKAAAELAAVGQAPVPKDVAAPELAAWTSAARTILNLHEAITRN
jgi:mono/diheme cytochrome c family protein